MAEKEIRKEIDKLKAHGVDGWSLGLVIFGVLVIVGLFSYLVTSLVFWLLLLFLGPVLGISFSWTGALGFWVFLGVLRSIFSRRK